MAQREAFKEMCEKIGIEWKNIDLLHMALTHSSYSFEKKERIRNNQRLEFLGDAVLELVVSEYLYNTFSSGTEGDLTKLRASIVCEPSLARAAREIGIGPCLYMGRGEERSGGRDRPSILADAFEALLGAIYLDSGLEEAAKFALGRLRDVIDDVLEGRVERDYKTELQEILQKISNHPVSYVILKEEGPAHDKTFTAAVIYMGRQMGTGTGRSKKEAEQHAARNALEFIAERGPQ
ncbi:MAG: ribonuclease III [Peptococcaceae bacterium]|nr:ribonuclease III [Peptococcaceae bacterium]